MRKFLAFILFIPFTVIFFLTILLNNLQAVFLHSETYKRVLVENNLYERTLKQALDIYLTEENFKQVQVPFLTISVMKKIATRTISPLWLQGEVEKIIDNFFLLLAGESLDNISLRISLSGPKAKFLSEVQGVIEEELTGLPTCTEAEMRTLQQNQAAEIKCLPAGFTAHDIIKALPLSDIEKSVPEELDIKNYLKMQIEGPVNQIQLALQILNISLIIAYAALATLLVLIFLLTKKVLVSGLRWIGFSLAFPSGLGLLTAFLGRKFFPLVYAKFLQDPAILQFKSLIEDFSSSLFNLLFERYLIVNVVLFSAGAIFFILSFFLRQKKI